MTIESTRDATVVRAPSGPTVLRMLVGAELRRLREDAGVSVQQAGYEIRGSHSKISRLELGRVRFKERDVADLLTLYGVTDPQRRQPLLELVEEANTPGWWHRFADVVPSWFEPYLGLEQGASVIRTHELQYIPGLLQTTDYATALLRARNPKITDEELGRRVELLRRRALILERSDPVKLWVVLDEAALRRAVGGTTTMRSQLRYLLAVAEFPHITVQVMPFRVGAQPAVCGPITLLRFAERELPDVIYLEQLAGGIYPDRTADVTHYRDTLNRLGVQAEPPAATPGIIEKLLCDI